MAIYTIVDKNSGDIEEVEAFSSKQALYKLALDRSKNVADKKNKKRAAGILYAAMLRSHEAMVLNDPNQMNIFQ